MDKKNLMLNQKQLITLKALIELEEKIRLAIDNASHKQSTTILFKPKNEAVIAALEKLSTEAPGGVIAIFANLFKPSGS